MSVMNLLHETRHERLEVRQTSAIEIDFSALEEASVELRPDFADAIAEAADEAGHVQPTVPTRELTKAELRNVNQRDFDRRQAALVATFSQETGYAVAMPKKPIVTMPGPKASYELWKRVIPIFAEQPVTLEMSITALADFLANSEYNYRVTRNMLYRPMNKMAFKDANKLLGTMGIPMTLTAPASVVSIRRAFLELRAGQAETETFTCKVEIKGDNAYLNGKRFAVGRTPSGQRRIRQNQRSWVNLDVLAAICARGG